MEIITTYSIWYSVPCILFGALCAFVLYRKDKRLEGVNPRIILGLSALRTILVSILCFFLLVPMVKTINQTSKKPKVIIAFDHSKSVLNSEELSDTLAFLNKINLISTRIEEKYDVESLSFGGEVKSGIQLNHSASKSNFHNLQIDVSQKWGKENIGAILMISDGIINEGVSAPYLFNDFYPVYTIGVGDTIMYPDLSIKDVFYNKLSYIGNDFPVEIQVLANKMNGEKIRFKGFKNDTLKVDSILSINSDNQLIKIKQHFLSSNPGVEKIRFEILNEAISERNVKNNVKEIFVEVLDKRQSILFLSTSPHPDEAFFLQSLVNNDNYEINKTSFNDFKGDLKMFNMIVFSGIPENFSLYEDLFEKAVIEKKNVLILPRNSSQISKLTGLGMGFQVQNLSKSLNDITPVYNENFQSYEIDKEWNQIIETSNPIKVMFGNYSFNQSEALYNQRIGNVETTLPLVHFIDIEASKIGVFFGEGYWRWKLGAFEQLKDHELWKLFVQKNLRLLSVKEDRSQFNIESKSIYKENEDIILKGELYNDAFEIFNEPEIKIKLESDSATYENVFSKTDKAYYLNFGHLLPGDYKYSSEVLLSGKKLIRSGSFTVEQLQVEMTNLVANHHNLKLISSKNKASFELLEDYEKSIDSILKNDQIKTILYSRKELKDLLTYKWIFFVLIGLISIEWFSRKYLGSF